MSRIALHGPFARSTKRLGAGCMVNAEALKGVLGLQAMQSLCDESS
jgi:hypothetical protein